MLNISKTYASINGGSIRAGKIHIGKNVTFGNNVNIDVRGEFRIGDNSVVGDRFTAKGENIIIGDYFYNAPTDSRGMIIGGGSSNMPYANLTIGDRCTCHTGHINLAQPVTIGNDVGLSHDVDIITHGFWASVLDGYPASFESVNIGNNVIVGWKTVIMSGVNITDNVVIGAHSTCVKSITESGIYAGAPAKFIKSITELSHHEKIRKLDDIVDQWHALMTFYNVDYKLDVNEFPLIKINDLILNIERKEYTGKHDAVTDAFRDFLRRYGIRIFHERGFKFNLQRK